MINEEKNKICCKKLVFLAAVSLSVLPSFAFAQQVDTAWVRRYNGPGNGDDKAVALAVDDSGNVYVTGSSFDSATGYDFATIKYYPNGDTAWVRHYNGPDNLDDFAVELALDDSGYAYVTGTSTNNLLSGCSCPCGFRSEFATIKYTPNGDIVWVKRSHGGAYGLSCDSVTSLALDKNGNVYVTGMSSEYCGLDFPDNQYRTIKYASNGDSLWANYFPARLCYAPHAHLAVDGNGSVYVAAGGPDYVTVKYDSSGDQLWMRTYNGPSNGEDFARAIAVDSGGNTYVTGSSGVDFATIKYDSIGNQVWIRRFGSFSSTDGDGGYALVANKSDYVYVAGRFTEYEPGFFSWLTFKYDSVGSLLWFRYSTPDVRRTGTVMALDSNADVYVAGGSGNGYLTIKYQSDGSQLWERGYAGSGAHTDQINAIAVDNGSSVYVTGVSFDNGTDNDYATIKYSPFPQMKGDLNADGILTASDVVLILNCAFLGIPPPNAPPAACDLNCDGVLTAADVVILLNMAFLASPPPC